MTFNTKIIEKLGWDIELDGFKPCYKWMTFNTPFEFHTPKKCVGFKPCYKWMTFNTQ